MNEESVLRLQFHEPASGGLREVALRFVDDGGRVCILAGTNPVPGWAQALPRALQAQWSIGRTRYSGRAESLEGVDAIRRGLLARFERKYGADTVLRWFGTGYVGFSLLPEERPDSDYPRRVEELFDASAADYDRIVDANPLDRHMRDAALEHLRGLFRPGSLVLEIGCGTGLETLPLAEAGVQVVAVDISQKMVDRLEAKARAAGLEDRITAKRLRASDIAELESEWGPGVFDGGFSDFGALNCEPEWARVPEALSRLLCNGAPLALGLWNRVCLEEMAFYALRLRPARALARLCAEVPVGFSRYGVPVHAFSVGEVLHRFSPSFRLEGVRGLSVALPPYDFARHVPRPDELVSLLGPFDRFLGTRFPWNRLGDHVLLTLRRR